jgi:hypothetical protein
MYYYLQAKPCHRVTLRPGGKRVRKLCLTDNRTHTAQGLILRHTLSDLPSLVFMALAKSPLSALSECPSRHTFPASHASILAVAKDDSQATSTLEMQARCPNPAADNHVSLVSADVTIAVCGCNHPSPKCGA